MDYQNIHVVLIGNVTQDAAVKQAKESGKTYGDFRLAVRNRTGETTYFPDSLLWQACRKCDGP